MLGLLIVTSGLGQAFAQAPAKDAKPPNVVIIFIDDLGYADIGPFGCDQYPTPHLDRLAAEGMRLTDFHAASAVCSASRAALLTGCYPSRVGINGALFPDSRVGLNPDETTLAELCQSRGYATACVGKWHLGCLPEFFPSRHGFDEFFGLLYSNDMWPYPYGADTLEGGVRKLRGEPHPPLQLYDGETVVDANVTPADQTQLTKRYTTRAVAFINRHADRPFFLYVPHTMVHVPIYASEAFRGRSGGGLYGDVVMELDWSVGQILDAIAEQGIAENTLVVFTSDNGPWLAFGEHAGSAGPFREGKLTMFEGGHRVPCLVRWPGVVPAGADCDELTTAMDLLPTIANWIGAERPVDRKIDGRSIAPLLRGEPGARSPHEIFYGYLDGSLQMVRDRRWALQLPHRYRSLAGRPGGQGGKPAKVTWPKAELALFDLQADPGEARNVAAEHPNVVARLQQHAERARHELGDRLTKRIGSEVRPPGRAL